MKKSDPYFMKQIILLLAVCFCTTACKTKDGFFRMPFEEYMSDAQYFRAVGQAEDADIQTAKSKAIHLAKVDIARNIRSVCQQVITNYIVQTDTGNKIELTDRFESVSTETVSESLTYVTVKDVIYKKGKNNLYTCYAKVEMPTGSMLELLSNRSSEKMEFNPELFSKEYTKVLTQAKGK